MKRFACIAITLVAVSINLAERTDAKESRAAKTFSGDPPFNATLSNTTPLVFGMNVEDVSRALGQPLGYVSGRAGDEIYLAIRNVGGSGLVNHHDRLFLQFRKGRLTGWKADWGHNWMWE